MCAVELTAKADFLLVVWGYTPKVHRKRKARIVGGLIPFNRGTGSQHNEIEGNVSLRFGLVWMISS